LRPSSRKKKDFHPLGIKVSNSRRRPKNKEPMIERSEKNRWIRGAMKRKHHLGPRRGLREQNLRFGVTKKCLSCLTDLSQTIRCSHFAELNGNNTNTFILQSIFSLLYRLHHCNPPLLILSDSRANHILDTTNFIHG
jgi:hypothetical protein